MRAFRRFALAASLACLTGAVLAQGVPSVGAASARAYTAFPVGRRLEVKGTTYDLKARNGFKIDASVVPGLLSYGGVAYAPIRLLGDVLGATIHWTGSEVVVTSAGVASSPTLVVKRFRTSLTADAPNVPVVLDGKAAAQAGGTFHDGLKVVPFVLRMGRSTYLPIPWITRELGFTTSFDGASDTILVADKSPSPTPPVSSGGAITLASADLTAGSDLIASIPTSSGQVAWFLRSAEGTVYPIFGATTSNVDVPLAQDIPAGAYTLDAADGTALYTASINVSSSWTPYTASGGSRVLDPFDVANRYGLTPLYMAGFDGQGETIALFEESDIQPSDLATFDAAFGLPLPDITVVAPEGDPGINTTNEGGATPLDEATLDVEWAHGLAPYAHIVIYAYPLTAGPDQVAQAALAASQMHDTAYSVSFTVSADGTPNEDQEIQSSAMSGLAIFAATGDHGTSGPPFTAWPATNPYVIAVGGTEATSSGDTYWNLGYQNGTEWAGGYGTSDYPAPSWQIPLTGLTDRTVPDVSLLASNALLYESGSWLISGGTSLASPSWAAVWALVSQSYEASHGSGLTVPAIEALYATAESTDPQITSYPAFLFQSPGNPAPYSSQVGFGPPLAMNLARDLRLLY